MKVRVTMGLERKMREIVIDDGGGGGGGVW